MGDDSLMRPEQLPSVGRGRQSRDQISFDGSDPNEIFSREVRGVQLSGVLRNVKTASKCNIIEVVMESFVADSVDFDRCDFKDDAIRSARFTSCNFGHLTFAYNAVWGSRFDLCTFPDTDIHNCEFYNTVFVGCDFSHVLIKNCTFIGCEFRNCLTSNKVFETSRFADCSFQETELQVETIEDNFGITSSEYAGRLRDDRAENPHRKLDIPDLQAELSAGRRNPLRSLNIEYFVRNTLLDGSTFLDAALKLESWLPLSRTAGSFAVVLSQWVEFLLWLYERDGLTAHVIIELYSMTGGLLARIEEERVHTQALATIGGTHLTLARALDTYLATLDLCVQTYRRDVMLLVEGEDSEEYYYRELSELFKRADAQITALVPHNSPWDMLITFTQNAEHYWFFSLFLASRTEMQLARIKQHIKDRAANFDKATSSERSEADSTLETVEVEEPLVSFALGGHSMPDNPTVSLSSRLPWNLSLRLKLDIGSQQIAAIRRTLKDIL